MSEYNSYQAGEKDSKAPEPGRAQSRYTAGMTNRQSYLDAARESSELTVPRLIPPDGWNGSQPLYRPFQSVGADGVNNLTSKLMLALFPPNQAFARLRLDGKTEDKVKEADRALITKLEERLSQIEKKIANEVEAKAMRPHLQEGVRHLLVAGNVVFHFPEKHAYLEHAQSVRVFHLDKFVVFRSPNGDLLEIVIKEPVSPRSLDDATYLKVKEAAGYLGDDKTCDLYTHVYLDGYGSDRDWKVYQEVYGQVVPGSEGTYPLTKLPWLAMRWIKVDGENYSPGYIEDSCIGDLKSLEGLEQSIVEGSAAMAKILIGVKSGSTTKKDDIEKAQNGAVLTADFDNDVTVLHLEKTNDLRVAAEEAAKIEKRLAKIFMQNSSAQRSGERVTAEEWRFMVRDIEDGLGGIYSVLAHELQLPLVRLLMERMTKEKKIPAFPKGSVRPVIITGLDALGRGHDLDNLREFVKDFITALTPEIALRYINAGDLAKRLSTGRGIDPTGLIKTDEEMAKQAKAEAQAAQQKQMMETVQKLGPHAMKLATGAGGQQGAIPNGAADGQGVAPAGAGA